MSDSDALQGVGAARSVSIGHAADGTSGRSAVVRGPDQDRKPPPSRGAPPPPLKRSLSSPGMGAITVDLSAPPTSVSMRSDGTPPLPPPKSGPADGSPKPPPKSVPMDGSPKPPPKTPGNVPPLSLDGPAKPASLTPPVPPIKSASVRFNEDSPKMDADMFRAAPMTSPPPPPLKRSSSAGALSQPAIVGSGWQMSAPSAVGSLTKSTSDPENLSQSARSVKKGVSFCEYAEVDHQRRRVVWKEGWGVMFLKRPPKTGQFIAQDPQLVGPGDSSPRSEAHSIQHERRPSVTDSRFNTSLSLFRRTLTVRRRGYLIKRGQGKLGVNKRRWFVLANRSLYYYESDKDSKVIDTIDLMHAQIYYDAGSETSDPRNVEVHTPERPYVLVAESGEDAADWFTAIRVEIEQASAYLRASLGLQETMISRHGYMLVSPLKKGKPSGLVLRWVSVERDTMRFYTRAPTGPSDEPSQTIPLATAFSQLPEQFHERRFILVDFRGGGQACHLYSHLGYNLILWHLCFRHVCPSLNLAQGRTLSDAMDRKAGTTSTSKRASLTASDNAGLSLTPDLVAKASYAGPAHIVNAVKGSKSWAWLAIKEGVLQRFRTQSATVPVRSILLFGAFVDRVGDSKSRLLIRKAGKKYTFEFSEPVDADVWFQAIRTGIEISKSAQTAPLIEGYLVRKSWPSRDSQESRGWFKVQAGLLVQCVDGRTKDYVWTMNLSMARIRPDHIKPCVFHLYTPHRMVSLTVADPDERAGWIQCIARQINVLHTVVRPRRSETMGPSSDPPYAAASPAILTSSQQFGAVSPDSDEESDFETREDQRRAPQPALAATGASVDARSLSRRVPVGSMRFAEEFAAGQVKSGSLRFDVESVEKTQDLEDVTPVARQRWRSASVLRHRHLVQPRFVPTANLVIEAGSAFTKVGATGDMLPQRVFPTSINFIERGVVEPRYVGAYRTHQPFAFTESAMDSPLDPRFLFEWDDMIRVLDYGIGSVRLAPEEHPVCMVAANGMTVPDRQRLLEIMFEDFKVPAFRLCDPGLAILRAAGVSTGMYLSCGNSTQVGAFYNGSALPNTREYFHSLGGLSLNTKLADMIDSINLSSPSDYASLRNLKHSHCRVARDYAAEIKSVETVKAAFGSGSTTVELAKQRLEVPEALFDPLLMGSKVNGIHKIATDCLSKCSINVRKDICQNIVIQGGSTLFPGFADRLKDEITKSVPKDSKVRIVAPGNRKYLAWIGARMISEEDDFLATCWSRDDYDEFGGTLIDDGEWGTERED